MKRILLLSEVFPPATGGSGRWFSEIYPHMTEHHVKCIVGEHAEATTFDEHFAQSKIQRANLSMRDRAPFSWQSAQRYLSIYKMVKGIAKQSNCEQLHAARPLSEGLICYAVAKKLRLPYVCYVHGEDISVARTSGQLKLVTSKVLNSAALVICNSNFSKQMLLHDWHIPDRLISIVNPGVDTNYFAPTPRNKEIRSKLGWNDRPVILTVGRLQRRKGQDNYIRSLALTKQIFPHVLYAVVGDGPCKEELSVLARQMQLQENIIFHGEVSDETIKHCYQQCDLFALPNRTDGADVEGFGMVSLEAQSCGKPALVGDSGGTPETVIDRKTGVVVDCTEPESIARQTIRLLGDIDLLECMGQTARNRAVAKFDWARVLANSSRMFAELAK